MAGQRSSFEPNSSSTPPPMYSRSSTSTTVPPPRYSQHIRVARKNSLSDSLDVEMQSPHLNGDIEIPTEANRYYCYDPNHLKYRQTYCDDPDHTIYYDGPVHSNWRCAQLCLLQEGIPFAVMVLAVAYNCIKYGISGGLVTSLDGWFCCFIPIWWFWLIHAKVLRHDLRRTILPLVCPQLQGLVDATCILMAAGLCLCMKVVNDNIKECESGGRC